MNNQIFLVAVLCTSKTLGAIIPSSVTTVSINYSCPAINALPMLSYQPYISRNLLLEGNGYPFEAHEVQTADGYILELHRIPHSPNPNVEPNGKHINFQHGLLCSSTD